MIGDVLHSRYRVVDQLGFGSYCTVWLAWDKTDRRYLALKVGVADVVLHQADIIRKLSASQTSSLAHPGRSSIPISFDEFQVHGPNETHHRLFPLDVARALCGGLTQAIAYMHSRGFAHGDIHLPNTLLKLPSSLDQLSVEEFYEEYGEPETVAITKEDKKPLPPNVPTSAVVPIFLGKYAGDLKLCEVQTMLSDSGEALSHTTPAIRPPEARYEPGKPLSYSADVWSLAVAIWEILGMKAIFSMEYVPEDEIIAQWIEVLGRWVWPPMEHAFEDGIQKYRKKHNMGLFSSEETTAILDLMRWMLAFRPEERPSVEGVLRSEWMVKWVMPDYCRSR
ncbi:kinase domain protein [Aspergillus insuetus]